MNDQERRRLIGLSKIVVAKFNVGDWQTLGAHTGQMKLVTTHDRLLRSLSFNDPDYPGHAHAMIFKLVELDTNNIQVIADYINDNYVETGESISTVASRSRRLPSRRECLTFQKAVSNPI